MRKTNQNKDESIDESWLLPYSDLLTLLVALFIVLFAMSDVDAQRYKELSQIFKEEFAGGTGIVEQKDSPVVDTTSEDETEKEEEVSKNTEELEELQNLQSTIDQYIAQNELADVLGTKLTDEGLLLTIVNDISFDSGSAVVKKEGKKVAKEVSDLLYTDPPHQIIISGHADDRPMHNQEFASNWELSVMRSINFMRLILENDALDPTRFSAKGFGEFQPAVPNTDEENRAKNRRVEVLVLPNYEINTNE